MEQPSATANGISPGTRLRNARTARGLSIDDVAQSLRLSPRIIGALEGDDYDQLPSPTYVRGYVRSYAMLLGLPPQPLIDAFNSSPQAARPVDMTVPAPVREVTSSDAMVRFGTLIVAALVIGLSVMWWSGQEDGETRRVAMSDSEAVVEQAPEETPVAATPVVEEEEGLTEPLETSSNEKPPAVAPSPMVVATPPPVATAADPNAPRVRVRLVLSADSWADVRDADQRRLLYETLTAGRAVSVEGVAPLSVFLGNVDGVQVEVDGKIYDASRHKRGEVARFMLGAKSGN